jgi:hypothetical protein
VPPQEATLYILAGTVEVSGPDGTLAAGRDGQSLIPGTTVRTSPDGRAAIEYPDGSVTRLDRSTEFTVSVLGGDPEAPEIEGVQTSGNTYHRVTSLLERGSRFTVTTPTAVAGVQGTEYAVFVESDGATLVAVIAAEVQVTAGAGEEIAVTAGEAVAVAADGSPGPTIPIPPDLLSGDWLVFNRVLEGDASDAGSPSLPDSAAFEVSPELDGIGTFGYPVGERVIVVVRDRPGGVVLGATEFVVAAGGALHGIDIDIAVGHHVTLTLARSGAVRDTTVVPLTIEAVDRSSNTITGTADPGAVVVVFVEHPTEPLAEYVVTTSPDGRWSVVTTAGTAGPRLDFDESYYVNARIRDADGDTTLVHE